MFRENVSNRKRSRSRRGATAVEFAFVAPLIFLFLFGSIEFGRAFMAKHCLEGAAADGARAATIAKATPTDVSTAVTDALAATGISGQTVAITSGGSTVSTATQLEAVPQWQGVTVSVSVPYSSVSWLPFPYYLSNVTLQSSCTQPREADAN